MGAIKRTPLLFYVFFSFFLFLFFFFLVSELAYVAGAAKKGMRTAMVNAEIATMITNLQGRANAALKLGEGMKLSHEYNMALEGVKYLKSLRIEKLTADAVAFTRMVDGQEKVVFGFRGTAKLRDLIPDAQLMFNKANIPRLNEAKAFVKGVLEKHPGVLAKR
jgi:hypothetical protein